MTIKESSKNSAFPILILMRHASRAIDGDRLSLEGHAQAERLAEKIAEFGFVRPFPQLRVLLHSSPKRRTQATLRALADECKIKIQIEKPLDERTGSESAAAFELRVKEYLDQCAAWADRAVPSEEDHRVLLACSHLDWLEAAVLLLKSDENDFERCEPWPPMTIRAYSYKSGVWHRLQAVENS